MKLLIKIWNKLTQNGCSENTEIEQRKFIIFTNLLFVTTLVAFIFFAPIIYWLKVFSLQKYILSTALILFSYTAVFILIFNHKIIVGKNCLLLLVFASLFFYDVQVGKWAGIHLYYLPLFLSTLFIFSWDKEKKWILVYFILTLIIIAATEIFKLSYTEIQYAGNWLVKHFYLYNSSLTLCFITLNAYIILKENNDNLQLQKQSKLDVQSLIDNTKGYIWSINDKYELIAFNISAKILLKLQYGIDCFEGYNMKNILALPNSPKEFLSIYERALKGESLVEEYFSNNNYFEIQASPLFDTEGNKNGATFHSRIISAKKLGEQNLMQAKINLETLIDSIGNSTWSLTKEYKIIAASNLYKSDMKKIFGVTITPGFDISTLFDSPNYPHEWKEQYIKVFKGESLFIDYIFEDEYFELNAVPIKNIHKEVVGAVFFSRNITYRKNIEKELDKARIHAEEATVAKAQFLSNMSHELRTPLNGIIGLTNILLSEEYLPSQAHHLETLKYSSDHMLVLINDILDYNKIEAGKILLENDSFNLNEVVDKIHSFFSWEANKKGINFKVACAKELNIQVKGDVTRLRQVITNLISNAIKFTEKGYVYFYISIIETLAEKTFKIRFSIKDSGIGIEKEKLTQIFESFSQADASTIRKYGGSGLGLTISKKLIELMGSTLQVESELGKGSDFWFDLVFEKSTNIEHPKQIPTSNNYERLKGLHILIVEDNPVNMLVVSKILETKLVKISKAKNGSEAVEMMLKHTYDLVLMDLQMPIMDGKTATEKIRSLKIDTPIIALTANIEENLKIDLKNIGIYEVIQKPFVPADLYNKISSILESN